MSDTHYNNFLPNSQSVWKRYTVSHTSLQAASLINDIEMFSLGAKEVVEDIVLKHSVAFTGTLILGYSLSVGIAGNLAKYLPASTVFVAPSNTVFYRPSTILVNGIENFGATTSVRLAAISIGANLDQSTAGSVDIWVKVSKLP